MNAVLINLFETLVKPIQRLMRFGLLFQRLLESTPTEHADYPSCVELLAKCSDLLDYIDTVRDGLDRIRELRRYESDMSFKHAVTLDGKRKRAPKFSFQVYHMRKLGT